MEEDEKPDDMESSAIDDIMKMHQSECVKVNDSMNDKYKPLYRFTHADISNNIKHWIFNDINYKNNLLKTMQILSQCSLSGQLICDLSMQNIRNILEETMIEYMSYSTVNIIFHELSQMKLSDSDDIKSKSAEEIGYIMFNYPLDKLIKTINDSNAPINGQVYIEHYKQNENWMHDITGWTEEEIYQIHSVLFMHHTFTTSEIIQNIDTNQDIDESLSMVLKNDILPKCDIELIHYKLKKGECVQEFSDLLANHFDSNNILDTSAAYKSIAQCFIPQVDPKHQTLSSILPSLDKHQNWVCSSCGNYNFAKCIDSKMQNKVPVCNLCGLQQIDSIILQLKGCNTYNMRLHGDEYDIENKEEPKIDSMIQQLFNSKCPHLQNDEQARRSILRLAKSLLKYKQFIDDVYKTTDGDDSIQRSTKVDIEQFVDDIIFKKMMIDVAKKITAITDNHIASLSELLNHEENILNAQAFISLNCSKFSNLIHEHTNIKTASIQKQLFRHSVSALKDYAQIKEFGSFLGSINADILDADYHYILRNQIITASKQNAKKVFDFFEHLFHSEDENKNISESRSLYRRHQKINANDSEDQKEQIESGYCDDNMWSFNQRYIQNQLDVIYCYLVHSQSKIQNADNFVSDKAKNSKYVSDLPTKSVSFSYSHPYLSPIHCCIRDEMLYNTLYTISPSYFDELLYKAVQSHKVGLTVYREELICRYFKREYNIIRNATIDVRHALAVTIYADVPHFCKEFVSTYRSKNDKEKRDEMVQRHRQLYHYARSLFEAVEFFGQPMDASRTIYHSLSTVRKFHKFSVNFMHPISATTSKKIGKFHISAVNNE